MCCHANALDIKVIVCKLNFRETFPKPKFDLGPTNGRAFMFIDYFLAGFVPRRISNFLVMQLNNTNCTLAYLPQRNATDQSNEPKHYGSEEMNVCKNQIAPAK